MDLTLASISPRNRKAKSAPTEALVADYVARAARLTPVAAAIFESEAALLAASERQAGNPRASSAAQVVLFDSRGDQLTSEEFAAWLGKRRDEGAQRIVFAIGPANGWSAAALGRAQRTLSFGRMTMPHELARAVAAEQIYRALTILAGHPYHSGH
jgi:23S rRNA (pseudouridine1915-N3)-methyltransferase